MRAQVTIIVELGDPLPRVGQVYNCESYPDGRDKYAVRIQRITGLEWIDGKLAIDVRGIKIELEAEACSTSE